MSSPDTELHLNQEQLAAIGLLSARWSFFEIEMDFTVSALGQMLENDQMLPHPLNERIKRWRKLAREMYQTPEVYRIIDSIITRAKKLHEGRCLVLHARCYGDPKGERPEIIVETHKRRVDEWNVQGVYVKVENVINAANQLGELADELIMFNRQYTPIQPSAFPRTYP